MCSVTKCVYIPLNMPNVRWSLSGHWITAGLRSSHSVNIIFFPYMWIFFFFLWENRSLFQIETWGCKGWFGNFQHGDDFLFGFKNERGEKLKTAEKRIFFIFYFFIGGGGCLVSLSPVSHIDDILAFCSLLIIAFSINTISFIPLCLEQHMGS